MIKLNKSRVVFTDNPHSYHLDGKELCGVTTMLSRYIFKEKYFGVSDEVLAKAAERGSRVHEQCRAYDVIGVVAGDEVEAYAKIKADMGLTTIANEYTVSDNMSVASKIDLVAHRKGDDDNEVVLCDYKTTSHLDIEYLSWQLSVYKYLFELNNPDIKVVGIYGIWLPLAKYGKPKIEEIPFKETEDIERLIKANAEGTDYTLPIKAAPPEVLLLQQRCYDVMVMLKEMEKKRDELAKNLNEAMTQYDIKKWENDYFSVTRTLPTVSEKFDTKKFKLENPKMYEKYKKVSEVKGSIRITLKKQKEAS